MATATQLQKFTDFDRLFIWKNFIITLIGSVAAFSLSYYSETILDTGEYGPPFGLSLSFGVVIIVAVYTRNMASAGIVGLVSGIGIVSPTTGNEVDWALGYIAISFLFALILALLADKLLLVMSWIKLHLFMALAFTIFLLGLSILSDPEEGEYTSRGYEVVGSRDLGAGSDLPLLEIIVFAVLIFLILIVYLMTRKPLILDSESTFKYELFGSLFLLLGQAISFIVLLGFSDTIKQEHMTEIARKPEQLETVGDLLSHNETGDFYAVITTLNMFAVLAFVVVFTAVGISFLAIAKHKGNVEGMKGGSDIAYLAAPLGLILFNLVGAFYLQDFLYPEGFFISVELTFMFSTMIWAVFFYNQVLARIVLYIIDKILPQN